MTKSDRELGMDRAITRRDFLDGVAVVVGGALAASNVLSAREPAPALQAAAAPDAEYPPIRSGMRGAHPGSFESAHSARDGRTFDSAEDTRETYDVVVVGGGLSGLSAAYFYRQMTAPDARILVLDNHDDFGGHAKRNEFVAGNRTFLATGGTSYMVRPKLFPAAARAMLKEIGVDLSEPTNKVDTAVYPSLGLKPAVFFDKETFGSDRLVVDGTLRRPTADFLRQAPLSDRVREDFLRLATGKADFLPGLSADEKIQKLQRMSYRDYLLNVAKVHPDTLVLVGGIWCLSPETVTAWFALYRGGIGFQGLGLTRPPDSPEDPAMASEDVFFPAGNSDIARMIVRSLVPAALPKGTMAEIETKRVNYGCLDDASSPVRIRLSSTAVRVKHVGDAPPLLVPDTREVDVTYVRNGKAARVRTQSVVLACNNAMIPYLCPEMPAKQKEALHLAARAVNMTTNVLLRDWKAFEKLGVSNVASPGMFYASIGLPAPRSFGSYTPEKQTSSPNIVSLGVTGGLLAHAPVVQALRGGKPLPAGLPLRAQLAEVRAALLQTPFEVFERHIREQLTRVLSPGGFDAARDVMAITVNRWPHGYALGANSLFDPLWPDEEAPHVIGRRRFGRIAIANSDASGIDLTQTAFDEAHRAVGELMSRRFGYFSRI